MISGRVDRFLKSFFQSQFQQGIRSCFRSCPPLSLATLRVLHVFLAAFPAAGLTTSMKALKERSGHGNRVLMDKMIYNMKKKLNGNGKR